MQVRSQTLAGTVLSLLPGSGAAQWIGGDGPLVILVPTGIVHVTNANLIFAARGVDPFVGSLLPRPRAEHPLLTPLDGVFYVQTGVEVGPVYLTVQLTGDDMETVDGWEVVAEAQFDVDVPEMEVYHYELGVERSFRLPAGPYTVRASCNGYDEAMAEGAATPGAPPVVSVLVTFLPPTRAPGRTLKNESVHLQAMSRYLALPRPSGPDGWILPR